jgi:Secretion system C-terminal sorting domain
VNKTEFPSNFCFTSIHPQVEVTNKSDKEITSFDVTVVLDGEEYPKTFKGSLGPNEETLVDWGEIEFTAQGTYTIEIVGFKNINNNDLMDVVSTNDKVEYSGVGVQRKAFSTIRAGFNTVGAPPKHVLFDQSRNSQFYTLWLTSAYGARRTWSAVLFFLHSSRNVQGKPGYIILGEAELSKLSSPMLTYHYAYSDAGYGGTAPTIKVEISEDCGISWNEISSETLTETGQPADNNIYVPNTNEFIEVTMSLEEFADQDVLIRVAGIPGSNGSAFYIDEIQVSGATSVDENYAKKLGIVYPNPATDFFSFNDDAYINKEYEVYSLLGNIVLSGKNTDNMIDISKLLQGAYFIKINNSFFRVIKK